MERLIAARRAVLPQGAIDVIRQIGLVVGAYYLYRIVRGVVDGKTHVAFDNARTLVDIERGMGLFFEPTLQGWALSQSYVVEAADWMYVNSHFTITTGFMVWLYFARNHAFYFVRNMFMIAMGLALVLYVLYPTAPPRLMPEWGFTDTVAAFVGEATANSASVLYNPFAAVPSMHVAFALMVAIPAVKLVRIRPLKVFWGIYPFVVTMAVMITANHFWVDAALGALVAAVSAYAASAGLARARPEAWAWRGRLAAEATA